MKIYESLSERVLSLCMAALRKCWYCKDIIYDPVPTKPAQEVIFGRKLKTVPNLSITFKNNSLSLCPAQNHLGLVLDSKLIFNEHINHILSKVNKSIGLLPKFQPVLPRSSLVAIYKTFISSHFDYANVVYVYIYKSLFHEKIELIQYNAALVVTGAIRGSSSEKLYQELGLFRVDAGSENFANSIKF